MWQTALEILEYDVLLFFTPIQLQISRRKI